MCIYPIKRKKSQTLVIWTEFEVYVAELLHSYPKTYVILGGDFNARMGPNEQALYSQHKACPPTSGLNGLPFNWQSKDRKANYARLLLHEMTTRLNLHVLNGLTNYENPFSLSKNRQSIPTHDTS